jgi:1,4-dihydroxy-2-naphthoate octaprenyltransferase
MGGLFSSIGENAEAFFATLKDIISSYANVLTDFLKALDRDGPKLLDELVMLGQKYMEWGGILVLAATFTIVMLGISYIIQAI